MEQNVDRTTEKKLCTGCGICAAICPVTCIHYERRNEIYEPVIDYTKCIQCGKCLKACPGYSYSYQSNINKDLNCYSVQAKDRELLKNASSGGLITTMILKLLQDEQYQTAFLVVDYNYENQVKTEPIHKGDDLRNTQQSRYLPVSQERAIEYIKKNPSEKIIYVGTSCAVHGLCKALRLMGKSRENILIFGLFCDQTMTYSIYEYIRTLKNWDNPVSEIHFRDKRAGGWPGNIRIEFCNGTYKHFSAKERILVKDFCRQRRCLYCLDKLNVEADLSVGDNYTKRNDSIEGSNSLIVRTELGEQVWEYCKSCFTFFPADYCNIIKSQGTYKKIENQLVNNIIYSEKNKGQKIENGVPYDLLTFELSERKAKHKDKMRLKKQIEELSLGERAQYSIIRKKRFYKLAKLYWNGMLSRLHLKRH